MNISVNLRTIVKYRPSNSLANNFTTSITQFSPKIIPTNIKKFKKSSQDWLTRQLNDPYVKLAYLKNYRARSAFKLIEINNQYKILKPGLTVVECGAAPGAWTQVIVPEIKCLNTDNDKSDRPHGLVIAVDILHFLPVEGAVTLSGCDFTLPETTNLLLEKLQGRKVDLVLSDMAPNASGNKEIDHECIMELAISALKFAVLNSKIGSTFLCKIWDGHRSKALRTTLEKYYKIVKIVKPHASRDESAELFYLAKNFQGLPSKAT